MKLVLCLILSLVATTVFAQGAIDISNRVDVSDTTQVEIPENPIVKLEKETEGRIRYYDVLELAYAYFTARKFEEVVQLLENLEDRKYRETYLDPFTDPNDYSILDFYLGVAYSETGKTVLARHFLKRAKKWMLGGRCKGKRGPCYNQEKMDMVEAYYDYDSNKDKLEPFEKVIEFFHPASGVGYWGPPIKSPY